MAFKQTASCNTQIGAFFSIRPSEIEFLMLEAHQLGFVRYNAAGGVVRIDWPYADQRGAIDALLEGTAARP